MQVHKPDTLLTSCHHHTGAESAEDFAQGSEECCERSHLKFAIGECGGERFCILTN